jgi:hypothetical protein
MTAREYVGQLERIDILIASKAAEKARWEALALDTGARQSGDKVQASGNQQKMAGAVESAVDIDAEIASLQAQRHKIMKTLEKLQVDEFWMLNEVYGKHVSIGQAAWERGKSYSWGRTLHNRAMESLEKVLNDYIV